VALTHAALVSWRGTVAAVDFTTARVELAVEFAFVFLAKFEAAPTATRRPKRDPCCPCYSIFGPMIAFSLQLLLRGTFDGPTVGRVRAIATTAPTTHDGALLT
jgi:hypothetical protein